MVGDLWIIIRRVKEEMNMVFLEKALQMKAIKYSRSRKSGNRLLFYDFS